MPRRKGKDRKCFRNDIVPSISLELYAMFSIDTIIKGNFVVFFVWFFTALLIDIISFCRLASTPAMFNSTLTEGEQFLCPADGSIMITGNMKCTFLSNCIYLGIWHLKLSGNWRSYHIMWSTLFIYLKWTKFQVVAFEYSFMLRT